MRTAYAYERSLSHPHAPGHVHQQCKKGCYICDEPVKIGPVTDLLSCVMLRQSILKGLGR